MLLSTFSVYVDCAELPLGISESWQAMCSVQCIYRSQCGQCSRLSTGTCVEVWELYHACPACRLHARTVKKLGKRLQELSADQDAARQELLIKAAELLDMQAQLKQADGRQQLQQDAASEQVCGS